MRKLIKVRLIEMNMSGFELSRRVGIDPASLSKIVNGWVIPREPVQKKIAAELGVTVEELWDAREAVSE